MASNDPHSRVRAAAIERLPKLNATKIKNTLISVAKNDPSYTPILASIEAMNQIDLDQSKAMITDIGEIKDSKMIYTISNLFAEDFGTDHSSFFIDGSKYVNTFHVTGFYRNMKKYCQGAKKEFVLPILNISKQVILENLK